MATARISGYSLDLWLGIWVLLPFTVSCQKLVNDLDSGRVDCGISIDGSAFTRVLKPDGSSFTATEPVFVLTFEDKQWSEPKLLTPKGCLRHEDLTGRSENTPLLIKANIDGTEAFLLGMQASIFKEKNISLKPRKNVRFEWSCPLPVTNAASPIELALDTDGVNDSSYLFRYSIVQNNLQLRQGILLRPEGARLSLLSQDQSPLPDGAYVVRTELFDILSDPSLAMPLAEKTCSLQIDREAPGRIVPQFAIESDSEEKLYEIAPSILLQFPSADQEKLKVSYCLSSASETRELDQSICLRSQDFSQLNSQSFMPKDGYWKLHYFVEDTAGNKSPRFSLNLVIIDSLRLATQNNLILAAIGLLSTSVEKAVDLLITITAEFLGLKTDIERARLLPDLQKSWLSIGSVETPQTFLTFPGEVQAMGFLRNRMTLYAVYEPSTVQFTNVLSGEKGEPLSFPGAKVFIDEFTAKIYVFNENSLQIFDSKGKFQSSITLPRTVEFNSLDDKVGTGYRVFRSDSGALVLKDDKFDSFLEFDDRLKDVVIDRSGAINQVETLVGGGIQVSIGDKKYNWTLNRDDCLGEDEIKTIKFSPAGKFIVVESKGKTAILTPMGEQEECLSIYNSYAFSRDDAYFVLIENLDRRTSDRQQFAFDIKTTKGGFSKIYQSSYLPSNSFSPEFVGADRIIFPTFDSTYLIDFKGNIISNLTLRKQVQGSPNELILFKSKNRIDIWQPMKQSSLSLIAARDYSDALVRATSPRGHVLYETAAGTFMDKSEWQSAQALNITGEVGVPSFSPASDKMAYIEYQGEGGMLSVYNGSTQNIQPIMALSVVKQLQWIGNQDALLSLDDQGVLRHHTLSPRLSSEEVAICSSVPIKMFGLDRSGIKLVVLCEDGRYAHLEMQDGTWKIQTISNESSNFKITVVDPEGRGAILVDEFARGELYWWNFGSDAPKSLGVTEVFYEDIRFLKDQKSIIVCTGDTLELVNLDNPKIPSKMIEENTTISQFEVSESSDVVTVRIGDRVKLYSLDGRSIVDMNFERAEPGSFTNRIMNIYLTDQALVLVSSQGFIKIPLTLSAQLKQFCDAFAQLDRMNNSKIREICSPAL